jgi:hypothetical protein
MHYVLSSVYRYMYNIWSSWDAHRNLSLPSTITTAESSKGNGTAGEAWAFPRYAPDNCRFDSCVPKDLDVLHAVCLTCMRGKLICSYFLDPYYTLLIWMYMYRYCTCIGRQKTIRSACIRPTDWLPSKNNYMLTMYRRQLVANLVHGVIVRECQLIYPSMHVTHICLYIACCFFLFQKDLLLVE